MTQSLREQRTRKFLAAIEEGYNRYSRVPSVTKQRRFDPLRDEQLRFSRIGVKEEVPNEWFDVPNISADMFFYETGQAIATGEDNHIVKTILKGLSEPSFSVERPNEGNILSTIQRIMVELESRSPECQPSVLFSPISFMTPLMVSAMPIFRVIDGRDFVNIGPQTRLEIFWSNNYVNFTDFIMIDKRRFAEWIFKSDTENRLLTGLTPLSSGKHVMSVETVAYYRIQDSNSGVRVAIRK